MFPHTLCVSFTPNTQCVYRSMLLYHTQVMTADCRLPQDDETQEDRGVGQFLAHKTSLPLRCVWA